ncbi:unnamed protein product [Rotaria sp. Silwood1]|nr:unnamed protein product [Rotaria sp. Silwood1]
MVHRQEWKIIADIMAILIDIFNLAEQLSIYFISKENDFDESAQQRFFFILFAVGGASVFKPLLVHPILFVLFGISIEIGELVSYLKLLSNTTSLLVVAILFFTFEVIFHLISLIGLLREEKDYFKDFAKNCCTLPGRVFLYGLLFETQILFLFLDSQSSFRQTFYEVLMILATFFGLSAIDKGAKRCCLMNEDEDEKSLYTVWEAILALLSAIEAPIFVITAVVYASQALQHKEQLKTYDFVIYIIIIITYGSALLSLALTLLCTLCLCASAFFKAILSEIHILVQFSLLSPILMSLLIILIIRNIHHARKRIVNRIVIHQYACTKKCDLQLNKILLLQAITIERHLSFLNRSMSFYVYTLVGSQFRLEIRQFINKLSTCTCHRRRLKKRRIGIDGRLTTADVDPQRPTVPYK